jgi:hypothetical protein
MMRGHRETPGGHELGQAVMCVSVGQVSTVGSIARFKWGNQPLLEIKLRVA